MSVPAQLTVSPYGDIGSTSSFVNIRLILPPKGPHVFLRYSQVSSGQFDDVGEKTRRDVLGIAEAVLRDGRREVRLADRDRHLDAGSAHGCPHSRAEYQ